MKDRQIRPWILVLALCALSFSSHALDAVSSGDCAKCHGENGISTEETVPILAGQSVFVIADAIFAFQEGDRLCGEGELADGTKVDHCELVKGISEDDQEAIGEYYNAMGFQANAQSFDAEMAEAGAKLHNDRCERCHTEAGTVTEDDAGLLAGQWSEYLRRTMHDYQAGTRVMPDKMAEKMEGLTADDVEALVQFYASKSGG